MPAWSPEIANEFILLARADGRVFDQLQLQKLVYIAHGWCLAITGAPLTGDRPEAWEHGPIYRRLADALASHGLAPVTQPIRAAGLIKAEEASSILESKEREIIARIYKDYRDFDASQLSTLTRRGDAPWAAVFADGAGKNQDISHQRIRDQFVQLATHLAPTHLAPR